MRLAYQPMRWRNLAMWWDVLDLRWDVLTVRWDVLTMRWDVLTMSWDFIKSFSLAVEMQLGCDMMFDWNNNNQWRSQSCSPDAVTMQLPCCFSFSMIFHDFWVVFASIQSCFSLLFRCGLGAVTMQLPCCLSAVSHFSWFLTSFCFNSSFIWFI